ncbi:MAG: hydroxyacid dehydrogenase [Deltaproteobacteria bacterium RBG_16_48_10]|nr:MAG: hydroxyacid dehydrogenase [Deltaproteobacteria bacterium RBG_16_48_10]
MGKYKVFLYENMHEEGKAILREKADISIGEKYDEDYLIGQVKEAEGIIIRANGRVTPRLMDHAPKLKVVGRHGVGVENVDIEAATEKGIWVVYTPEANSISVAEHFFGLAIMLSKMIRKGERAFREEGRWEARYQYVGNELHGKTLGILGFGRIGKTIGRIGHQGFNMKILYYDVLRFEELEKEIEAARVSLEELLAQSDFVSVNLPMLPSTKGILGAREFGLMKKTAHVINLARGPIWDEKALYKALKEGKIAGAGADVYEVEPATKDHPLLQFENFIGTPHMAAHTEEALKRMSRVAVDILRVLDGNEPIYPVNRPQRSNR